MPKALTPLAVKNMPTDKAALYADGQQRGLYLQVSAFGTKSWIMRYMVDGRARKMGLGSVDDIPLAKARAKAKEMREALKGDGVDPIEARKAKRAQARLDAVKGITFQKCAEQFIAGQEAGWKSDKHAGQWAATLETYAYPIIGNLPVGSVDTGLILKVLEPIWTAIPETAGRVRGRIESILNWATVREYRQGENPARWRGHLVNVLPKPSKVRKVKHHPAMPYSELPGFMGELRKREGNSARALEFTILTAVRTGETIGARWDEIDLNEKIWTVPAGRMKAGKEHRVPLTDRALAILQELPRKGEFVFVGAKKGRPLSNMAMLELLRGMRGKGATVHGFRSTFRDWASERTNYHNHVVEMALAHTIGDKVEAAYRRGDLFDKRARLMGDWAQYCEQATAATGDNVRQLRHVARA